MLKIERRDTINLCLSDFHSAGSTALFPNTFWQFDNGINHTPNKKQKDIWRHFQKCIRDFNSIRNGRRLMVFHDGDAIDGVHHGTPQVVTRNKNEQMEVHCWLMDYLLREIGFDKEGGDRLYYIKGTEVHVNDSENIIGKDLDAERNGDLYAFDFLPIEINGRLVWFYHQGASAGKGANVGNALRNSLKNIYYENKANGQRNPDMVVTGHVHKPIYETFSMLEGETVNVLHGMILPSWQQKTRFAYKVAPSELNKIGMAWFGIDEAGNISTPEFRIMKDNDRMPVRV